MKTYDHSDSFRERKFVRSSLFAGIVRVPGSAPNFVEYANRFFKSIC